MRALKFRAWTGKSMFYQEDQYLNSFLRRAMGQIDVDTQDGMGRQHESYIEGGLEQYLMQYTGHNDIDGKEVYEGDLLKFPGDEPDPVYYLVKWLEDSGQWGIMFGPQVFNMQMGTIGLAQFLQVVGNIYENKELLNGREIPTS